MASAALTALLSTSAPPEAANQPETEEDEPLVRISRGPLAFDPPSLPDGCRGLCRGRASFSGANRRCGAMRRHAVPCPAMPCRMPCHAVKCRAMPCHAVPCRAMPGCVQPTAVRSACAERLAARAGVAA
jgi:hypothetical protein